MTRHIRLTPVSLLAALLVSGCLLPPDVALSPDHGLPPDIRRDASISGEGPIQSGFLARADVSTSAVHEAILLERGDDALLARIHLIRAARESIDIQTFIWVFDETGIWVYRELLAAARRGVKVRLLIDQFVPPGISANEYAALVTAHTNLEVRLFRPLTNEAINTPWSVLRNTFTRFTTLNRRMHNKVCLIDGKVAIIGGRNIQDAYYDRDSELCFRDRDILVSGPVVRDVQSFFKLFWNSDESIEASRMGDLRSAIEAERAFMPGYLSQPLPETFQELHQLADYHELAAARSNLNSWFIKEMCFISDTPESAVVKSRLWKTSPFAPLMDLLYATEQEILIETPYAVLGKKSTRLARNIRSRNPDVRIRVSTNSLASSDHAYVSGIAFKQRREQIQELNLEIHIARPVPADIREMVPRYDLLLRQPEQFADPNWVEDPLVIKLDIQGPRFCVHSKSLVIDRRVSFIGSHNFDPRSFDLNSECGLLIKDEAFSVHLASLIERSMNPRNSWTLAKRNLPPGVTQINSLASSISQKLPLFDVWPLENISAYELKEGCQPLSPYNPDFHSHYREAGVFPGVNLGLTEVQVQLVRAFGGLSAPLM